jgi:hypothetical protein
MIKKLSLSQSRDPKLLASDFNKPSFSLIAVEKNPETENKNLWDYARSVIGEAFSRARQNLDSVINAFRKTRPLPLLSPDVLALSLTALARDNPGGHIVVSLPGYVNGRNGAPGYGVKPNGRLYFNNGKDLGPTLGVFLHTQALSAMINPSVIDREDLAGYRRDQLPLSLTIFWPYIADHIRTFESTDTIQRSLDASPLESLILKDPINDAETVFYKTGMHPSF